MGTSQKAAERKIITELTELLKKNSDSVLSGRTNLCLTTSSLSIIAVHFRRYSENAADNEETRSEKKSRKDEIDSRKWQENIRTLMDFVLKVKALKVIHGSYTMKAPIQISRFRSLQVLEVKKVPIHMVEGLSKLRGQLREITVSKSLQTLKDLLEICGGDRTPGLVWPHLKKACLSFNTIQELDQSLKYIPFVEVLDLSHNSIDKAGDYLRSLLDLMRINLGFNMLKAVPQFSSSNRLKVKTLVLRNNSLESLDGVEELVALEELDVSENYLLDHKVLEGLLALKRLQVLCLLGNPLSYKSNHRVLTLQYIYPQAGLGVFLLDGKRLNQQEMTILQENQYRKVYTQDSSNGSLGSDSQRLDYPDTKIAVSHLTPHGSKKKRGHQRKPSRERIPQIKDFEASLEEEYMTKSEDDSPSTSFVDGTVSDVKAEEDERYYETLREHYKDDWLKALSANQKHTSNRTTTKPADHADATTRSADSTTHSADTTIPQDHSEQPVKSGRKKLSLEQKNFGEISVMANNKDSTKTAGRVDQQVIEAEVHPQQPQQNGMIENTIIAPSPQYPESRLTEPHATEYPPVPLVSPTSPEGVKIGETTDIYSLPQSASKAKHKQFNQPARMYSTDSIEEPLSPKEDTSKQYGAEGEPHIMMLPDDDMKPLIVTTNQRFLIEKDLSGNKMFELDLKCLKRIDKTEEKCYGRDLIGGFLFTILKLDFDYVRKDMRQRRYAVESNQEADRFQSLVSHHIQSQQVQLDSMQCLKCQHEFEVPSADQYSLLQCPNCTSKMVIKSDKDSVQLRLKTPPEQPVEELKESKRRSWHRSTIRRSRNLDELTTSGSHRKPELPAFDEVDAAVSNITRRVTTERHSLGSSLKDYVDKLIPEEAPDTSTESFQETKPEPYDRTVSQTESGLRNNLSWSDVGRSGITAARGSVSSVESDITVLPSNSSRGSVAAITESSSEVLAVTGIEAEDVISSSVETAVDKSSIKSDMDQGNSTDIAWRKDGQGHITPVGSPISTSVCSSMVSSVYENTLAGTEEEDSLREDTGLDSSKTPASDDDVLAESVLVRRSKSGKGKNRRSNNRGITVYDGDLSVGSGISVTVEDTCSSISSRESSIYDSSFQADISTFQDSAQDSSVSSIYDTAASHQNLESSLDHSKDLHSQSSTQSHDQSHDQLSANRSASDHSSPLRRKGSRSRSHSRSRSNSRNRSAVYVDESLPQTGNTNNSAMISQFPSELSPIKRTNSARRSKNRSAMFIDNTDVDVTDTSVDLSTASAQISHSEDVSVSGHDTTAPLPWEQSDNQSTDTSMRDESLNHDEFVNIDHNIKLYLELQVFHADETAQCTLQCAIEQYLNKEAVSSLLVISTHRIIMFRIEGDGPSSPDWLKSYEDQPITELRYIDIGLGYQTLRLEFETMCSSYTLLLADEIRCKKFLTLISDIVAHSDHSHLEKITKSNPDSLANLEQQVLCTEEDSEPQEMVRFLMVKYTHTENTSDNKLHSLVVTQSDLVLLDENHQWPLPRLQAPLTGEIKGRQFTIAQREKINNIGTLCFNEEKPTELQISFLETSSQGSPDTWYITFETMKGVKSFVDAIRKPWETEFGVSLDITSVSFAETSTSSVRE